MHVGMPKFSMSQPGVTSLSSDTSQSSKINIIQNINIINMITKRVIFLFSCLMEQFLILKDTSNPASQNSLMLKILCLILSMRYTSMSLQEELGFTETTPMTSPLLLLLNMNESLSIFFREQDFSFFPIICLEHSLSITYIPFLQLLWACFFKIIKLILLRFTSGLGSLGVDVLPLRLEIHISLDCCQQLYDLCSFFPLVQQTSR